MKAVNAVIGGEGNGGVILPELHYGRDSLVGIALFLSHLAKSKKKCSELRKSYPDYFISKNKIELTKGINPDTILKSLEQEFKDYPLNKEDGLRVDFEDGWVHMRKSNTEPIIRIYSESKNQAKANDLAKRVIDRIKNS